MMLNCKAMNRGALRMNREAPGNRAGRADAGATMFWRARSSDLTGAVAMVRNSSGSIKIACRRSASHALSQRGPTGSPQVAACWLSKGCDHFHASGVDRQSKSVKVSHTLNCMTLNAEILGLKVVRP